VGWTDRLLILSGWAWVSVTAWHAIGVQRTAITSKAGQAQVIRAALDMDAVAD